MCRERKIKNGNQGVILPSYIHVPSRYKDLRVLATLGQCLSF